MWRERAAVAVGVAAVSGCLIGAGGVLLYSAIRRKSSVDLRREMSLLRHEIEGIRNDLRQLVVSSISLTEETVTSPLTEDELEEYFDALDSEPSTNKYFPTSETASDSCDSVTENGRASVDIRQVYDRVDGWLDSDERSDRNRAYELLKRILEAGEHRQNDPEFMWRLSRTAYLYGQTFLGLDEAMRKKLIFEALDFAFSALDLNAYDADVQKWCALTLGSATDFMSLQEKIKRGHDFKYHIDFALSLRPEDPILHHLCGRWCFGVASLSWLERKVASTLFSEPPTASYEQALSHFLKAEELQPGTWIENLLHLAKTLAVLDEIERAVPYLKKAVELTPRSQDDRVAHKEAQILLKKYARD